MPHLTRTLVAACLLGLIAPAAHDLSVRPVEGVKGTLAAIEDDSEVVHVERLFSNAPTWVRPAPILWSSRPNVRWNARWQGTGRYAV